MRHRLRGESGQAMTETMLVLGFVMLMVMGTITLCLLMTTKQVADYAAFGAARTSLTHGFQQAGVSLSAAQVLYHTQKWWESSLKNRPGLLLIDRPEINGPRYVVVPFRVPYGLPIFNELPSGGLLILGRSRFVWQHEDLIWRPSDDD